MDNLKCTICGAEVINQWVFLENHLITTHDFTQKELTTGENGDAIDRDLVTLSYFDGID